MPSSFPPLPPADEFPWSADVINAHQGLELAYLASQRALELDESDPIRLGHHLKQAETFMGSIIDALSLQSDNPLPDEYIEKLGELVDGLVNDLQAAYEEATLA